MNIPLELLSDMLHDDFYQKCCITGKTPIQFHHNFIFGYGKVNEKWCILPLHKDTHDVEKRKDIKNILDWIMLNRADDETLKKYSKVENLISKRARLNEQFGGAFNEKTYERNMS